jgi:outer membrane protein TolC
MKRKNSFLIVALGILFSIPIKAQINSNAQVFTPEQLIAVIKKEHPLIKQFNYEVQIAEANKLNARGNLDPNFDISNEQKSFAGDRYYFYTNTALEIPTWYGIDVYAGTENAGWNRLEPSITSGRSSYLGVKIPVVKNLWFDKRRAQIQQSRVMLQQTIAAQQLFTNDIIYDALKVYWDWAKQLAIYEVFTNALENNRARYVLIKKAYQQGDRSGIDTTEALSLLQQLELRQQEAWQQYINDGFELSNYLWQNNNALVLNSMNVRPDTSWITTNVNGITTPVLEQSLALVNQHPKMQAVGFKQEWLQIEKKAKFQDLLPKLDLKYNFLTKGYDVPLKNFGNNLLQNNFKYGFNFNMPVFRRSARAQYQSVKLKLAQNQMDRLQEKNQIENKIKIAFNDIVSFKSQVNLINANVKNFQRLFDVEVQKLSIGESSMFLVNSRAQKLIETKEKQVELQVKYFKSLVAYSFANALFR